MAKIIAIAQLKGGVGKSTLTTNLVGSFAKKHRVALIDADMPQGTSSRWAMLRQDPNIMVIPAESPNTVTESIEALDAQVDFVVIDLPPRSEKFLREALTLADLVLMPILASAADVWATEQLVEIINDARKANKRLRARLVWNRVRVSRDAGRLLKDTATELKSKELSSLLFLRTVYSQALGEGKIVAECKDAKAALEWSLLMRDICKQLEK
jgi:chromosome partitioning protein